MKIITKPSVHVLAIPLFNSHPQYMIPPGGTMAEQLITHAGKGCYDSYGPDGRSISEHIHNLMESKHWSVLEHANISLFIEGISRGCSHEIVRHRHFSFSQRSTRYTSEEDAAIVLEPYIAYLYDKQDKTMDEAAIVNGYIRACEVSLREYANLTRWLMEANPNGYGGRDLRKWARGKSRQILPHALETRMTMTGNIRTWIEFFQKRISPHAEAEICQLAETIRDTILPCSPLTFGNVNA